jgi:thiol-disulfide isomerase/thioredoxin
MKNLLSKKQNLIALLLLATVIIAGVYLYSKYRIAPDIVTRNFSIIDKSGNVVPFSSLYGKNMLVVFFASWCGPCVQEMYYLEELKKELGTEEFRFVALSDESFDKIERFALRTQSSFEFYRTQETMKQIGVFTFPTAFVINSKDKIVFSHTGNYAWNKPGMVEKIRNLSNQ